MPCRQAGTIHNEIGIFARVVGISCVRDMPEHSTLENDPIFAALGYQPREIDSSVNANRRESIGTFKARRQFLLAYYMELEKRNRSSACTKLVFVA